MPLLIKKLFRPGFLKLLPVISKRPGAALLPFFQVAEMETGLATRAGRYLSG